MLSASVRKSALTCVVGASSLLSACTQGDISGTVIDSGEVTPMDGNAGDAGGSISEGGGGDSGTADLCPDDPDKTAPGACGCGAADTDGDGDKTPDCKDKSMRVYLMAGQSNMVGGVDATLFGALLDELASGDASLRDPLINWLIFYIPWEFCSTGGCLSAHDDIDGRGTNFGAPSQPACSCQTGARGS